ncbi:hypothetical protein EVG20_g6068 [Dentipellis fragilis]|uniref:Reverse transcriptase Ty1/copia-type domain-containing protein n=1 Tax=Dentipellis fragilis TaxID=205917 RepID=A0A4Y9YSI9_9AGAM|nr:hypothetical protein EVG20_g6068 [Dentipellis fragilis]
MIQNHGKKRWLVTNMSSGCKELQSLKDLKVYKLVPRDTVPRGRKILKGRLVCTRKRDEAGVVKQHKVQFICKGFEQVFGQDYNKTTAPTARMESFHALLQIAAAHDWDARQFDVKTAFLYGVLPEEEAQYMEQPEGFEEAGKEDWVWLLQKGLYGMKQSGRIWNKMMHTAMVEWGFEHLPCEWCIYYRKTRTGITIVVVHVDDMLSIASNQEENEQFYQQLKQKWVISDLGEVKFTLGIAVQRNCTERTMALSQKSLINRVLTQFRQQDADPAPSPMEPSLKLAWPDQSIELSKEEYNILAVTPYRSLVGCLMYLAIGTRPDIAFAVRRLTGFMDCYHREHWNAALRVVRYLKGPKDLVLTLGGEQIQLVSFTDSDYANCTDTRRSIGGYCFALGTGIISWASRKQRIVTDSTCYAEYIAAHEASKECLWLRHLLSGLDIPQQDPTPLLCDNNAVITLSQDQALHARSKHYDITYHLLRQCVEDEKIVLSRVRSSDNPADIFTKALGTKDFCRLRDYPGVR